MNGFEKLKIQNWRQFRSVSIDFHDRLTILTGANGAGKTTILSILSRHFGWSIALIGTLKITKKGARKYYSGVLDELTDSAVNNSHHIGTIGYGDGPDAQLEVPAEIGDSYNIEIRGQQQVDGIYITSHRPVYSYQKVENIPTDVQPEEELFDQYLQNLRQFYTPNARVQSPSHRIKTALISLATFGPGNEFVRSNPHAVETLLGFQKILKSILPSELGFRKIDIRPPDVIFECDTGDFPIDGASGGVAALVDIAWQLFMKSRITDSFVAIIDEPENHLHPRLQRTVLPGLIDAFPNVQFIVATHNPFVVSSVEDSTVVVLDYVDDLVESQLLPETDRSGSANKILSDVLGVPVPIPLWVEERIEEIVDRYADGPISDETLAALRDEMIGVGLGRFFPTALSRIAEDSDD